MINYTRTIRLRENSTFMQTLKSTRIYHAIQRFKAVDHSDFKFVLPVSNVRLWNALIFQFITK